MKTGIAADFQALSTTISSIYDLRGIGVSAVYVSPDLWEWMKDQGYKKANTTRCPITGCRLVHPDQDYDDSGAEFHISKSGNEVATMKPYGANRRIPVKVRHSGDTPWKVVVGYRKEDA